jgi:hypothetical protein
VVPSVIGARGIVDGRETGRGGRRTKHHERGRRTAAAAERSEAEDAGRAAIVRGID